MSPYIPRYQGPRWTIVYGNYEGVTTFALDELYRSMQACLPYVLVIQSGQDFSNEANKEHAVLLGTPESNPFIQTLLQDGTIQLSDNEDGFSLCCIPAPWDHTFHCVVITGKTSQSLLHGVHAFNAWILANQAMPEKIIPEKLRQGIDNLSDFQVLESPVISERGIWTWGYVIYDHRRFLDHMARLRMNCLTIWNDTPPLNCRQLIAAAHERGIRLILGFNWGWGMDYNLADPADRRSIQKQVLQHYQEYIAPVSPDGIYFQTLTEHKNLWLGQRSVASLTGELVNQTVEELYRITPGLDIHFGLHATSIRDQYHDLENLDPRITIVWEDAGVLPFSYDPTLTQGKISFSETVDYACELANFRPGSTFAMVAKGWTTLDWTDEFEHHGPFLIGTSSRASIRHRLALRQPRWDKVNRLWLELYPQAQAFYRTVVQSTSGKISVLGLIEDGLFEETIQPSVALLGETLWNPFIDSSELLTRALSSYYQDKF